MARKRIEVDEDDTSPAAQVLALTDALRKARRDGDHEAALELTARVEAAAEELGDDTLAELAEVLSRRDLAASLNASHTTVNRRIARHRQRQTDQEQQFRPIFGEYYGEPECLFRGRA